MRISHQFMVFLGVGVACAVIDISTMQLLIFSGVYYGLAASIGFSMGVIANYILHAKLTFSASRSKANAVKFAAVVLVNYGITMVFIYISAHLLGEILAGKIASLPVVAINGFLLSRYWVFK